MSALPIDDKERKMLPILTFLTEYFPDAILAMVRVCVAGNIQHNPELAPADIKWARGKSADQLNTAFRHLWDHKVGLAKDSDGQYHLAKAMWRIGAALQLQIERDNGVGSCGTGTGSSKFGANDLALSQAESASGRHHTSTGT